MSDQLPTELVIAILQEATELFIASDDRAAVLSIALTAKFVYELIRPAIFRRAVLTDKNAGLVGDLLLSDSVAPLVRELCIADYAWSHDEGWAVKLSQIRCLRGFRSAIDAVINKLPSSGRKSVFKLQVWDDELLNVPASVTHICLLFDGISAPSRTVVEEWLDAVPSLTHLGCEFVARRTGEEWETTTEPDELALGIRDAIAAGGTQLSELALRFCGNVPDDHWNSLLVALHGIALANQDMQIERRLRIWRDQRVIQDLSEDMKLSIADALAGVDVWSEARTFHELYNARAI